MKHSKLKKSRGVGPSKALDIDKSWDDEISSGDSDVSDSISINEVDDELATETHEQKRRRLAESYLASIGGRNTGRPHDDEFDEDVANQLSTERLKSQGKLFRDHASKFDSFDPVRVSTRYLHADQKSVTGVAISSSESAIYSCSKDGSIIHWDVETEKRLTIRTSWSKAASELTSHAYEILCVAVSGDDKYVASGGRDNNVRIFDPRCKSAEIQCFKGHRDAVTCLAFRKESNSLFSGSLDRCIKHWDLKEMGYIETMFGHQDGINSLDCTKSERPLSSSSDRTVRQWRVSDESHLVFRGSKGSVDVGRLFNDDSFITSGQDGALCLWRNTQKRPVVVARAIHGFESSASSTSSSTSASEEYRVAKWVSSLAVRPMSNLAASGSYDGFLRLWDVNADARSIEALAAIPLAGFINDIALSARLMVVGVGKEHRLGRWWCLPGNKNKVGVIRLPFSLD